MKRAAATAATTSTATTTAASLYETLKRTNYAKLRNHY
jgi:hypothetical protein